MQWWGALTQQFQTIAAEAMKDAAQKSATNATQSMAKDTLKTATSLAKDMAGAGRAAMNTPLRSAQAWPTPVAANKPIAKKPIAKKPAAKKAAAKKTAAKTARQTTR